MALCDVTSSLSKTAQNPAIKYTVEHHRKDGVSKEAFKQWFTLQFLPRVIPILKKHNILKLGVVNRDKTEILTRRAH